MRKQCGWRTAGALLLLSVAAGWPTGALARSIVSGFHWYGGYGVGNTLYQWQIGDKTNGSDTKKLGTVGLTAVFGYSPKLDQGNGQNGDMAMLSDRRIVLSHMDASGNNRIVSVLTCLYDASGNLTNAVDNWDSGTVTRWQVVPLPNNAFACVGGDFVVYTQVSANAWAPGTATSLADSTHYLQAGLLSQPQYEIAVGSYARDAYRVRETSGWMARYDGGGYHPWGSDAMATGLRHPLLSNGWLVDGKESKPTVIMDGTETGQVLTNGVKGKMRNADGSDITGGTMWAGLSDSRVVRAWKWGWGQAGVTWQIYSLVQNPSGQPAGSIGATGATFSPYTAGNLVGKVVGDYQALPFAPQVGTAMGATNITTSTPG